MSRFEPTNAERAALDRTFALAEGHSGGSLRARALLFSWWNGSELGGFHLSDLWSFDDDHRTAALTVIQLIARAPQGTYADVLGYDDRMRRLAVRRAKELELGAHYGFERWDEARQQWMPSPGEKFDTRVAAEDAQGRVARALGCEKDNLQVVAVWDDD
jgi:hypothetical protein